MPLLDIKQPAIIDPDDFDRDPSQVARPAVPQTIPADGYWQEEFFFAAGTPMLSPLLQRRGAEYLLVQLEDGAGAASGNSTCLNLFLPSRNGPAIPYMAVPSSVLAFPNQWLVGAYGQSGGSLSNQQTMCQAPVPPTFRVGGCNTANVVLVAPANGAIIRVIGLVPSGGRAAPPVA